MSIFDAVNAREHSRLIVKESLYDLYNATKGKGKNKLFSTTIFRTKTKKRQPDFYSANIICLDIDQAVPVADFIKRAGNLRMAAFATQNHLSYRYGQVQERYRVPIVLDRPVTSLADYLATVDAIYDLFGDMVDVSCKDAARKFYFSNDSYAPLYINEMGEPFKVVTASEEHKQRAMEIIAGRKVDPISGFNDAKGDFKSIKIGGEYFYTDLASSKSWTTLKKIRKESLLLSNGQSLFVWLPAVEPDFVFASQLMRKNGENRYLESKIGVKGYDTIRDALYYIDIEKDISFIPGLRVETPTGLRIWNRVSKNDLQRFRDLIEGSAPAGTTFRTGTLDRMARCPVIPSEIMTLKDSAVPLFDALEMTSNPLYKKALKAKRLRDKRGKNEVFERIYSPLASRLATMSFKGDIPEALIGRNKASDAVLRVILGSRSFAASITDGACFAVNVYTTTEACSALGVLTNPMAVSRVMKRLIAEGYLETDGVYQRLKHSKRYKPTQKMKDLLSGITFSIKETPRTMESLPEPTYGTFNNWVFKATRFARSEAEFLSQLDRLYGSFMREKEDRFTEAKKAWKSHAKRQAALGR